MAKILIVEDDNAVRRGWQRLLEMDHHTVFGVSNGLEGLAAIVQFSPQIVFCDYNMPIMDGGEFVNKIRNDELYRLYSKIPVIGVGSFPNKNYLTELFQKPVPFEEIKKCIDQYVK
jgi:CheY-like chemotaxis protein